MHHVHDHRALRRATDSHALGAMLAIGLGLAALVGVALDSCHVAAADVPPHGVVEWSCSTGTCRDPITDAALLRLSRVSYGSQRTGTIRGGDDSTAARLWVCVNRHVLQRRNGLRRYATVADSCSEYSTLTSRRHGRDSIRTIGWPFLARRAPAFRAWAIRWARGEIPPPPGVERAVHTTSCPMVNGARRCTGGAERFPGVAFYGSNGAWAVPRSRAWSDAELPRLVTP